MKDGDAAHALAGLIALFAITAAWWLLALWPVNDGPEWLARTRYVCFGVNESGLPNAGGWIGLIGGPAGMLVILVLGWQRGMLSLLQQAHTSRGVRLAFALLALGVAVLVTGAALRVQQARSMTPTMPPSTLAPDAHPRLDLHPASFRLIGQNGDTVSLEQFRGRPVLVTFAFAHCSTICPLIVQHVLRAQEQLRSSPDQPAVLVITVDPWRDTPSRLETIALQWRLPDDAWVLSGPVEDVEATLDAWQIPRIRDERTGDVTHPSLVYVLDCNGRIAFASTGDTDTLIALLRRE